MQYIKYHKIESNIDTWNNDAVYIKNEEKKWIVLEKVHGANFSFIYENKTDKISCGKRTGIIQPGEHFYCYETILDETIPKIKIIIDEIKALNKLFDNVIVYGELFGGIYPEIKTKNKPIQKGVFYSPNINFYAFDILIIYDKMKHYLDYELALDIFRKSNIFHAEPLAIYNNLAEALRHPIGFNSTIPEKLGLPALNTNKAEGIIIKGLYEPSFSYGINESSQRLIVKIKIPEFSETIEQNPGEIIDLYKMAEAYMTENRYNNAISKVGDAKDAETAEAIYDLFVEDILEELNIKNKHKKNKIKGWLFSQKNTFISKLS